MNRRPNKPLKPSAKSKCQNTSNGIFWIFHTKPVQSNRNTHNNNENFQITSRSTASRPRNFGWNWRHLLPRGCQLWWIWIEGSSNALPYLPWILVMNCWQSHFSFRNSIAQHWITVPLNKRWLCWSSSIKWYPKKFCRTFWNNERHAMRNFHRSMR